MSERQNQAFRHVYHIHPVRLLLLPVLWLGLMALLVGLALDAPAERADEKSALLQASAIFTLIMLPFFCVTWQSRLVLSAEGIAHHQLGYTVRSSWANLETLYLQPGCEALYLKEPGTRSALLRISAKLVGGAAPNMAPSVIGNADLLGEGRAILLFPFMHHFRRGPLRSDIQKHAPHLFPQQV